MHSSIHGPYSKLATLSLTLTLVTLWLLMRGYHGLTGDGQIYAFQAFARIHPQLTTDLYLQNTSQDQFSVFSPLYAWFIGSLGLEDAARLLTVLFTGWLLAAGWSFARAIICHDAAWLAIAFLLIVAGDYGGSGVFHLSEPYLTARLPAESLIVTALACHVRGRKPLGLLLAAGALFVHPLIGLPGLLLLICLSLPGRVSVLGAILGVLATLGIAVVATNLPANWHVLSLMDTAWLDVVQERSQFLFLQLWSVRDWSLNLRPFIYLAFTAIVIRDERLRKLCTDAMLVGATGLAVAFIAGVIGPVAILVQGQAWRWIWVTVYISALLLPVTVLQVWRDDKCGPLCAILLVSGWTLPVVDGTACVSLALFFWLTRNHVSARAAVYSRWASTALGIAIVGWLLARSWTMVSASTTPLGGAPFGAPQIRDVFGLRVPALLLSVFVWWFTRTRRTECALAFLSTMLVALSIYALPAAFRQSRALASTSDINEFADWAEAIPPKSTVLVVPARDVGAFVWFTLERPNYLAVDQSAGVVFSRVTALEVQRRSQVLLPLMDANWKILANLRTNAGNTSKDATSVRSLTAKSLIAVCSDPQLGFVISRQDVGFERRRHAHAGSFKDWSLYDCRQVRLTQSST